LPRYQHLAAVGRLVLLYPWIRRTCFITHHILSLIRSRSGDREIMSCLFSPWLSFSFCRVPFLFCLQFFHDAAQARSDAQFHTPWCCLEEKSPRLNTFFFSFFYIDSASMYVYSLLHLVKGSSVHMVAMYCMFVGGEGGGGLCRIRARCPVDNIG
jgi:hypothetical protein